jgi:uncharacterized protein (TIGR02466 family)
MNNHNKKISMWFPSLIYENILEDFSNHNNYLASKAYKIKSESTNSSTNWSCDTYSTLFQYNAFNDEDPLIQNLIKISKECVLDFSKEFGIEGTADDIECIDFWFNIAAPGAYQEYHLHPKSHFSLVYYVQTQKQCGNIVFQTADTLTDMFPLIADQATYASYKNCFYTPKDSLLLIFKSTLLHMVEKNLSDKDRISVAMNFKFKEK